MVGGRSARCFLLITLVLSGGCRTTADPREESSEKGSQAKVPASGEANVMPVTVNGSLCMDGKFTNTDEICTSVVVCVAGTKQCQTINGIMVDTGSSGLRLFASAVTLPLAQIASGNGTLAGCASFSGGKSSWGPIVNADIVLGGEPAVTTSVFMIDKNFGHPTGPCDPSKASLDASAEDSGFNGILGVSHHREDCGDKCRTDAGNNNYFSCGATACASTTTTAQLVNPVSLLPTDHNGIILTLPSVPVEGAISVTGTMTLGIGTRSNNQPGNVTVFATDDFSTTIPAFAAAPMRGGTIDSGSSKYYLPKMASLPLCEEASSQAPEDQTGELCPAQPVKVAATISSGKAHKTIDVTITSASQLEASGNRVSAGFAAAVDPTDPYVMWGLPFFLGRTIYIGIEDERSSLGTGPYWAL